MAADGDASVRAASVELLAMFDFDHAAPALATLAKDGDAAVAQSAKNWHHALRQFKNLNPDLPY